MSFKNKFPQEDSAHPPTVQGKRSSPPGAHSPSFHPTVLLEKAVSTASGPAVLGSGVSTDLLRGRGALIQSVIKHTAHLTDPNPPCAPVAQPPAASAAGDQTRSGGTSGPVLSAWVSHHINTQGLTVNTASLV
ncbi:unnamed protein product [Pleuronectes platessa]|uniref:Uncharacterized protein n=1 Tax=Pleuronectes platessa TaxID=8262 RepID=A0A9N7W400_PLEPL|nr:unnamed protein product [Pleuronectes platessa]